MPFSMVDNIVQWAGSLLSPASSTAGDGTQTGPVVRSTTRVFGQILSITPLSANGVFTSSWVDRNKTGDIFVVSSAFSDQGSAAAGWQIQETDDIGNTQTQSIVTANGNSGYGSGLTLSANTVTTTSAYFRKRFWRVVFTNGVTNQTIFELTVTATNVPQFPGLGTNGAIGSQSSNVLSTSVVSAAVQNGLGDGQTAQVSLFSPIQNENFLWNGASYDRQRTPNIFRGSQFSASGSNVVWQPTTGKKFRLMKYKIEVAADATVAGGATPVNLAFSCTEAANGAIGGIGTTPLFNFNHRMVVPGSSASSFAGYDTGWIDLGNGILSLAANQKLTMGIQAPQSVSAVSPAWTITSNQWEAVTVGFKTQSNAGLFRLMDSTANDSVTGTVAGSTSLNSVAGDTIVVVIRTTNAAGGAPTVVVTDTYLNTYTTTALTTNASDGAHGSSLCIAYCTNIASAAVGAGAANVITVTTSVNVATAMGMIALEYSNMGSGGIDAALVGTTGNSTTAASGSYTPATTGDLIITAFATAGAIAPISTVNSNFRSLAQRTNQPLSVADNFGNGSLATGQINVIACGTEE